MFGESLINLGMVEEAPDLEREQDRMTKLISDIEQLKMTGMIFSVNLHVDL